MEKIVFLKLRGIKKHMMMLISKEWYELSQKYFIRAKALSRVNLVGCESGSLTALNKEQDARIFFGSCILSDHSK
jgi:hypothetical protein